MRRHALLAAVAALALSTAAAAPALAQQDDKRISDLQRQVRELRSIVFQGRDTGQPVEVKPVGPDPQVVALQGKVDDLEQSLRQLTGQNEVITHDLDEARRGLEQERTQAAARNQALSDRIAKLEGQIQALQAAAAPAAAAVAPADLPPSAAPAAAPVDPAQLFDSAAQRLAVADYVGAQAGFEAYLAAEPAGARAAEARYSIGQSLYARESYPQAARAYALSLKGWPKAKWAPDATVRLAASLNQAGRASDACAALGEFDRRYAATALTAVKARAAVVRKAAACTAG
jgi:TolA-binding protein